MARRIYNPTQDTSGGANNYDALRQTIGRQVLQQGGKLSDVVTALDLLKPSEGSAAEEKTKTQKETADRAMTLLEDLYFGTETGSLAYGRKEGLNQTLKSLLGNNADLANYTAQRTSIRPTLARALGDVGNLSQTEQVAAVKGIPTGLSTPEEAIKFFASTRQKFGLPSRELTKVYNPQPTIGGTKTKSKKEEAIIPEKTSGGGKDLEFWQRALGTSEKSLPVPLPNLPYQGIGTTIGGMVKNPALAALLGGGGNWLDQLKEGGIPLTKEGAKEYQSGGMEGVKAAATSGGLNLLLHPIRTLGGIRELSLGGKTFGGNTVVNAGKEFLGSAGTKPQYLKTGENLLQKDITKFGGKELTSKEFLDALIGRGKDTYKAGGDIASNAAAKYNSAIRNALRQTMTNASPIANYSTNAMDMLYKLANMANQIKKIALYGSIGAGAAYGVGKAFGKD